MKIKLMLFFLITSLAFGNTKDNDKANFVAANLFNYSMTVWDVETTVNGLRANPDCRELNSLFYGQHPNRLRLYTTSMSINAAITIVGWKLITHNHSKRIWIAPFALGVAHGIAAGNNMHSCPY